MPKKQTTAAQKARAAARDGQKYTTALRENSGNTEPGSWIPAPPTPDELLTEGRQKIRDAMLALADAEPRPRLEAVYRMLADEVTASRTGADLPAHRANFAFRRADDYYRRQWDAASANPSPVYEEHMAAISGCYWARRVSYEWWRPGVWDKSLRGV